jgi:hypothetical protein
MSDKSQQRQPLLGNSSVNTLVAGQWLSIHHVMAANRHAPSGTEILTLAYFGNYIV